MATTAATIPVNTLRYHASAVALAALGDVIWAVGTLARRILETRRTTKGDRTGGSHRHHAVKDDRGSELNLLTKAALQPIVVSNMSPRRGCIREDWAGIERTTASL
jgi:hypothetical protein